jgi:hypothetical protein
LPVALYLGGQKGVVPRDEEGFRYDAYVSYVDREPDTTWVWDTLVPRLEEAGLRVAVSGDVEEPGVARVVNVERGIKQAKRTVVVLYEKSKISGNSCNSWPRIKHLLNQPCKLPKTQK